MKSILPGLLLAVCLLVKAVPVQAQCDILKASGNELIGVSEHARSPGAPYTGSGSDVVSGFWTGYIHRAAPAVRGSVVRAAARRASLDQRRRDMMKSAFAALSLSVLTWMPLFGQDHAPDETHRDLLEIVEQAFEEKDGPQRNVWLASLPERDRAIRAAFEWFTESGESDESLRLVLAIEPYWLEFDRIGELRGLYRSALAIPAERPVDHTLRARALRSAGVLAMEQRDLDASRAYLEEMNRVARDAADSVQQANALLGLARLAMREEDHELLERHASGAIDIYRRIGNESGVTAALHVLGNSAMMAGQYEKAIEIFSEALRGYRERESEVGIGVELFNIASNHVHLGNTDEASELLAESLAIFDRLEVRSALVYPVLGFGWVATRRENWRRAGVIFGAVEADMERQARVLDPAELLHQERYAAQVKSSLGKDEFEHYRQQGRAMSIEQLVEQLLSTSSAEE